MPVEMDLLSYTIQFDQTRNLRVEKHFTQDQDPEVLFSTGVDPGTGTRTVAGLKAEVAYQILKDYKDLETSEVYLWKFVDRFLKGLKQNTVIEIAPGEIEHWLDVELAADPQHITGQKHS